MVNFSLGQTEHELFLNAWKNLYVMDSVNQPSYVGLKPILAKRETHSDNTHFVMYINDVNPRFVLPLTFIFVP